MSHDFLFPILSDLAEQASDNIPNIGRDLLVEGLKLKSEITKLRISKTYDILLAFDSASAAHISAQWPDTYPGAADIVGAIDVKHKKYCDEYSRFRNRLELSNELLSVYATVLQQEIIRPDRLGPILTRASGGKRIAAIKCYRETLEKISDILNTCFRISLVDLRFWYAEVQIQEPLMAIARRDVERLIQYIEMGENPASCEIEFEHQDGLQMFWSTARNLRMRPPLEAVFN